MASNEATMDPQIVPRYGLLYEGDIAISISMIIFIGLAVGAVYWARRYPDHRRNPEKDFVVFLLDPKSVDRGAREGQAGTGDSAGASADHSSHGNGEGPSTSGTSGQATPSTSGNHPPGGSKPSGHLPPPPQSSSVQLNPNNQQASFKKV